MFDSSKKLKVLIKGVWKTLLHVHLLDNIFCFLSLKPTLSAQAVKNKGVETRTSLLPKSFFLFSEPSVVALTGAW